MIQPKKRALVAYEASKKSLAQWAFNNDAKLQSEKTCATTTTGGVVQKEPSQFDSEMMKIGSFYGDQKIETMIAASGFSD